MEIRMSDTLIHQEIDGKRVVEISRAWSNKFDATQLPLDCKIELRIEGAFTDTDLSYLKKIPNLYALTIYGQSKLTSLHLPHSIRELNLDRHSLVEPLSTAGLDHLESATVTWNKCFSSLYNCSALKRLAIIKYDQNDLTEITNIKTLTHLTIISSKITSLKGVQKLENLEYLNLGDCRKLLDITDLAECAKLMRLEFEACKKIVSYQSIKNVNSLEFLKIENCAPITSLDFVDHLNRLKRLNIHATDVKDGKILRLTEHPSLAGIDFYKFKHFDCGSKTWHSKKYPNQDWTLRLTD